ncbi:keratin-associated protein 4-9-like [Contarinia nasturtii]|uniref:keratin-associated protein 4-9-like n=1 Tax=Contarinia nasturtii TaxID=265458 RepID=UPI0012D47959|nr:keratin-associated protein 4-9-like [Contarinia nasturtii]
MLRLFFLLFCLLCVVQSKLLHQPPCEEDELRGHCNCPTTKCCTPTKCSHSNLCAIQPTLSTDCCSSCCCNSGCNSWYNSRFSSCCLELGNCCELNGGICDTCCETCLCCKQCSVIETITRKKSISCARKRISKEYFQY